MKIGQRLRSAMKRADLNQKQLSLRSGIHESTISSVMSSETENPNWDTVETLVGAIGTTWGDLFDEPRIHLSDKDRVLVAEFRDFLGRLLANDAAQKKRHGVRPAEEIRNLPVDEVELLRDEKIPGPFVRGGARQAYRVVTDAMIGIGMLENSKIYVKPTVNLDAADGLISIVRLNKTLYLKRVDLRGKKIVLTSENPRYGDIHVDKRDNFELVAIVVN
jgi:transcriptional regulator with XRE-family HTH domain